MTNTLNQPAAESLKLTTERCYWREDYTPDLPETLQLELTADEVAAIAEARDFLDRNPAIFSVNVRCTPPEIDSWRYDVAHLVVFLGVGCYLYLQGKYDCSEQVEYSVEI